MHTSPIYFHIVQILPPFFKGGRGVHFNYLPQSGDGSEKSKKGGGSLVQGQVFLKVV